VTALEFWVEGTPKAQPRVKAFARGRHAGVYTPDTADGWKAEVRRAALAKCSTPEPLRGPLLVFLTFVMPRPKSRKVDYWHTSRPDVDNLAKAVLDALGDAGIWGDDAQVARMVVQKIYVQGTEAPGCTVIIDRI
jgi:Holliday junction resolvase RusA-like endonuclease